MPRSTTKTVLYAHYTQGGKPHTRPVAIFPSEDACRPFAVAAMTAFKATDESALKSLGMDYLISGDAGPVTKFKFSRVTLPYSPESAVSADDPFAEDKPPTT